MSYASDALVDALEQKNKRLEEENDKLRDAMNNSNLTRTNSNLTEIESLRNLLYLADVRIDDLESENAKLLELVLRMHRYMVGAVEHCGYDAQTTGYTMLGSRLEECEDAMRELGIEVRHEHHVQAD